jgi:hypothetical protein
MMNRNPIDRQWHRARVRDGAAYRVVLSVGALSALAWGCGATYAVPSQHLADTQSAERSATELGAGSQPKARLYLQLAHEQLVAANAAIQDGDNEKADGLLARAKSDAELAIALTRQEGALGEAQKASTQSNNQRVTNANQGAGQ